MAEAIVCQCKECGVSTSVEKERPTFKCRSCSLTQDVIIEIPIKVPIMTKPKKFNRKTTVKKVDVDKKPIIEEIKDVEQKEDEA